MKNGNYCLRTWTDVFSLLVLTDSQYIMHTNVHFTMIKNKDNHYMFTFQMLEQWIIWWWTEIAVYDQQCQQFEVCTWINHSVVLRVHPTCLVLVSSHALHNSATLFTAALQIAFRFLFTVGDLYVTTMFDSTTCLLWSELVQSVCAHAQTTVLQS